jgi:hypothetical protein
MTTKIAKKILPVSLIITGFLLILQTAVVFASNATTFSQTISDGSRSVDIVDADGVAVGSPGVTFAAKTFSFVYQTSAGTLGTLTERIRIYNPTNTQTAFTVSMAATGGATAVWTDGGSNTYDFNDTGTDGTDDLDTDTKGGRLTVDPSGASIAAVSPCASTSGISMGSSNSFKEVATAVTSITLVSGEVGVLSTYCRWDIGASTGISLSQVIPGAQPSAAYTIGFTITIA